MELVDVPDSKSGVGNYVSVRPRPSANKDSFLREAIFIIRWAMGRNDFLSVRRERAEAGELLLNVRKNMMQNSELPFNASEQDNPDHRQIKIASFGRLFLLSDGRWGKTTLVGSVRTSGAGELLLNVIFLVLIMEFIQIYCS